MAGLRVIAFNLLQASGTTPSPRHSGVHEEGDGGRLWASRRPLGGGGDWGFNIDGYWDGVVSGFLVVTGAQDCWESISGACIFFADADAASSWLGWVAGDDVGDVSQKQQQSRRFSGNDHHLVSSEKILPLSMCPRQGLTGRGRRNDGGSGASAGGVVPVLVPSAASLPEPAIDIQVGPASRT